MEHIIQFGVTIDDRKIEEEVIKQATDSIRKKVEDMDRRSWNDDSILSKIAEEEISKYISDHKDEILDKAISKLMANMMKTKVVKAKLNDIKEEN